MCVTREHTVKDIDAKGQNTQMSAKQKQTKKKEWVYNEICDNQIISLFPTLLLSSINKR